MNARATGAALALLALPILALGACAAPPRDADPSRVRSVAAARHRPPRWLVLGDSIAWDGRWAAHLQRWLLDGTDDGDPEPAPVIVDAALPSETVSGLSEPGHLRHGFPRPCLHERLARVLDGVQPDFAIVCYGINDAIYLPFAEERFAAFRDGIERLVAELQRRGIAFAIATPPPFDGRRSDAARGTDYDAVLARYSEWLLAQRTRSWKVADLHGALARRLAAARRIDPGAAITRDGVHLDDEGHLWFAAELIAALAARDATHDENDDAEMILQRLRGHGDRQAVALDLVRTLRDSWLTATGHLRPGLPAGLPLDAAEAAAGRLRATLLAAP